MIRHLLPFRSTSFSVLTVLTSFYLPTEGFVSSSLPLLNTRHILCTSERRYVPSKKLQRMATSSLALSTSSNGLFLFDFDGVVCDSCDECTVSAWRTCQLLNVINDNDDTNTHPPQWLFDKMREMRPAIEVGWQIPVLLSVFLEQNSSSDSSSTAMSVPEIIQNYEVLVDDWLKSKHLTSEAMIETFGKVRDDWIENDINSWLDINTFYSGISDSITTCQGKTILVTTKQQRFATALVRHAGIDEQAMSNDDIYGLGMYKSKADVIVDRMQRGDYEPNNTHFFEDRWPTIHKCLKDERIEGVRFYLCSWGYCTADELKLAEEELRVEVLTLDQFTRVVSK